MKLIHQRDEVYGIIRAAIRDVFGNEVEDASKVVTSHGWWRVSLPKSVGREVRAWVHEWMPMRRRTVPAFCRQLRAKEWLEKFEG